MNRAWDYWAAVNPEGKKQFIRIELLLEGVLARFAPANAEALELEPEATVGTLLARLGIREEEVMLAFVNARKAELETLIPDKAAVTLCPFICGE